MKYENKETIKVQTVIRGIPAWLYKNLDRGMRRKAIEKGLILIAEKKELRDLYYEDIEMVEEMMKISKKEIQPDDNDKSDETIIENDDTKPEKPLEDIDRWGEFKIER